MKSSPLLAILVVAGLFGWFVQDLSGGTSLGNRTDAGEREPVFVAPAQENAGEVVLPRSSDGHFYAEVTVDGFSSRMLVDTGATVLALTGEDAEAMGIYWQPDDVRPVARGAGGPVFGVAVTLGQVQVGDFEVQGVKAIVVPEGLGISLLGQSFLSQVERVEIDGEQMILGG